MMSAQRRMASAPQRFRPVPGFPALSIAMSSARPVPDVYMSPSAFGCTIGSVWSDARLFPNPFETQAFCDSVGLWTLVPHASPTYCTVGIVPGRVSDVVCGYVWFHRGVIWTTDPVFNLRGFFGLLGMYPGTGAGPAVSYATSERNSIWSQILYQPDPTRALSQSFWYLYNLRYSWLDDGREVPGP